MDDKAREKEMTWWLYIQQQRYMSGLDNRVWGYGNDMVGYLLGPHRRVRFYVSKETIH